MENYEFLENSMVSLSIITEKDFPVLFPLMNTPEVLDTMVYNYPLDKDEILDNCRTSPESAARGEHYLYGIILKETKTLAGTCGLFDVHRERKKAELGYWIIPDLRRRGIALSACSLVIDCAFSRLSLHKVWAETFATNLPSRQLLEKLHFRRTGTLEKEVFKHGQWADRVHYELLHPDP
jgi:[ribosomal protein S5]-alanine N-acetyltransferase